MRGGGYSKVVQLSLLVDISPKEREREKERKRDR